MAPSFFTRRLRTAPVSAPALTKPTLPRPGVGVRLVAGAASALITWGIVSALASYGLPADDGASRLAAARPAMTK